MHRVTSKGKKMKQTIAHYPRNSLIYTTFSPIFFEFKGLKKGAAKRIDKVTKEVLGKP